MTSLPTCPGQDNHHILLGMFLIHTAMDLGLQIAQHYNTLRLKELFYGCGKP